MSTFSVRDFYFKLIGRNMLCSVSNFYIRFSFSYLYSLFYANFSCLSKVRVKPVLVYFSNSIYAIVWPRF